MMTVPRPASSQKTPGISRFVRKVLDLATDDAIRARKITALVLWLRRTLPFLYYVLRPIYRHTYVPYVYKRRIRHIYALMSVEDWCARPEAKAITLLPEERVKLADLKGFHLGNGKQTAISRSETYMPAARMFTVKNAIIKGHSEVILQGREAIAPRVYLEENKISLEENERTYSLKRGALTDLKKIRIGKRHRKALCLVGATSANWAHFLTEVLPKIYLFIDRYGDEKVKVILDADLPDSINQCLDQTIPRKWRKIRLKRNEKMLLKTGIFISPLCHAPFQYRNPGDVSFEDLIFCESALNIVRQRLTEISAGSADTPEYLYVKRPANSQRPLMDGEKIDALMQRFGFTIVDPGSMSFVEQATIFSRAKIVVGQGGAGLMNIMFSPSNCRVFNLCYYDKVLNYFYFGAIAQALHQDIVFVFGEMLFEEGIYALDSGLRLDVEKLEAFMRENDIGIVPAHSTIEAAYV